MANVLVPWFLGKNLVITVTPQDIVAATGVLSDNAIGALQMIGRMDGSEYDSSYDLDNISPLNFMTRNPVPIEAGTNFTITEIMAALGLVTAAANGIGSGLSNVLFKASRVSIYHKVVITMNDNAGTLIESTTLYGLMTAPRRVQFNKGKSVNVASFQTVTVVDSSTSLPITNPAFA
jgi:hypothetical protein